VTGPVVTVPESTGSAAAAGDEAVGTTSLRRVSADILVYASGYGLAKLGTFFALPALTRAFSPADYGVLSSMTALMWLVVAASLVGGDSVYGRYFFEANSDAERGRLTSTWIGFLSLWSLGLFAALSLPLTYAMHWYLGGDGHPALVLATLATVPALIINTMCAQVLRNQLRSRRVATLIASEALLSTGLGLVIGILLHRGLAGVAAGNLLGEVLVLPAYLWAARSAFAPAFSGWLLRELLRLGVSLVPLSLAYWVFLTSDRILLGRLSSFHELGLYSVAVQIALVLNLLQAVVSQAWWPYAMRAWLQSPAEAPVLSGRFMTYLLAGFGLGAVAVTAVAPALLSVLSSGSYLAGAADVGPLVLGGFAYASILVTSIGVTVARRTGFLAAASIGAAILNVALNLVLDRPLGGLGAAWATAISYSVLSLSYLARSQHLLPVAYERRRSVTIVALTVGLVVVATYLGGHGDAMTQLATGAGCLGAFTAGLLLLGCIGRRELTAVRSLVGRH
jgi:O-antigen/teichoic acid export membrane protein